MVTVLQEFKISALASFWETVVGRNPKQLVTRKPAAFHRQWPRPVRFLALSGRPHGPRGKVGEMKEAITHAETEPPPPGHLRKVG